MAHLDLIRETRRKLTNGGSPRAPSLDDLPIKTLPESDCDVLRDLLVAENPKTVIEIGLSFGNWALAIGEALVLGRGEQQIIIDPFQDSGFRDAGWEAVRAAKLESLATLIRERSQIALPRLIENGISADAAFVDGSHLFHDVFVDLYYLQTIVRPGGLIVLDNYWSQGVAMAAGYFETNLGWRPHAFESGATRGLHAMRLPDPPLVPGSKRVAPFWPVK
ncbi:MAG: class I SAM-dependent methyltransferase [Pseudomonadota bacterium]